jgi:organic radical activating enzyme
MIFDNSNEKTKKKLDKISPSFCIAKWKQVTLHLQNGHTHSCHHPDTHIVPIEEIEKDPSALHNTNFKKSKRKQMLEGERPSECEYCWRVEDSAKKSSNLIYSDRITKSSSEWAILKLDEVLGAGYDGNINPSYVEVSFSNVCNFKCAYCAPHISSKWMEEVKEFGGYPTTFNFNNLEHIEHTNKMPIPEKEYNPYVEAFWKWWPSLYPDLHTFRITGGEPLLSKHTFKVLDWIIENPQPNLTLAINTNLCIPKKILDEFINKIKIIQEKKQIKDIELYTSAEAYGRRAEYIRTGLDYREWLDNCERILAEIPDSKLAVMATYNLLSLTSFEQFLIDILAIKEKYGKWRFTIDVPYLNHPRFLAIDIATPDFLTYIEDQIDFMDEHKEFSDYEKSKMLRIKTMFESNISNDNIVFRNDFVKFVDEYDKRRGTEFLRVFPEMENFYKSIKEGF